MQITMPDSRGRAQVRSTVTESLHLAERKRSAWARRTAAAREAKLHEAHLSATDTAQVKKAADQLVQLFIVGTVTRQQIEAEQRQDEGRLRGLAAAPALPGTRLDGVEMEVRYRMAARANALEQIEGLQLGLLTSTHNRQQHVAEQPSRRPWGRHREANSASSMSFLFREANSCNRSSDGRFGAKDDPECAGDGGAEPTRRLRRVPGEGGSPELTQYRRSTNRSIAHTDSNLRRGVKTDDGWGAIGPQKGGPERKQAADALRAERQQRRASATGDEDVKALPRYPDRGYNPTRTNASHNRDMAMQAAKGGMTPAEIAQEWPRVWKLKDGKLSQRYKWDLGDGRFETDTSITRSSVDEALAKRGKRKTKR